jgi:hypothetical protein
VYVSLECSCRTACPCKLRTGNRCHAQCSPLAGTCSLLLTVSAYCMLARHVVPDAPGHLITEREGLQASEASLHQWAHGSRACQLLLDCSGASDTCQKRQIVATKIYWARGRRPTWAGVHAWQLPYSCCAVGRLAQAAAAPKSCACEQSPQRSTRLLLQQNIPYCFRIVNRRPETGRQRRICKVY